MFPKAPYVPRSDISNLINLVKGTEYEACHYAGLSSLRQSTLLSHAVNLLPSLNVGIKFNTHTKTDRILILYI